METKIAPTSGRDNQIRRTARVLEIIQQISVQPKRWSRKELAEYHEISERMITRDLEIIRYRLGLQIQNDHNGYYFDRLPHLPTTAYSFAEAMALLMAARQAQSIPGINSSELAAAIARLESIFPDELRPLLHEATDQLPKRASKSHRQTMLALLHRARVEYRQVEVDYLTSTRGQVNRRVIEPYHLMPYGRSWHLIAYDHKRKNVLQFKVDRIQAATLLKTTYSIPIDFDVDEYLGNGWGLMRGVAGEPEDVVLLFEAQAGRWATEEQWHKSQKSEELANGRFRLTFYVGITPEMVRWLLYYGGEVWVERPLWLREEVHREHERGMKKNDG